MNKLVVVSLAMLALLACEDSSESPTNSAVEKSATLEFRPIEVSITPTPLPTPQTPTQLTRLDPLDLSDIRGWIVYYVNLERSRKGLSMLSVNEKLLKAAQLHSEDWVNRIDRPRSTPRIREYWIREFGYCEGVVQVCESAKI